MSNVSRRAILKMGAAGLAATVLPNGSQAGESSAALPEAAPCPPIIFKYRELGKTRAVASKDITASPLGVGFECLDRMMFDPQRAYPLVGQLGVKWARCQTGWARTERKPGEYDFVWLDEVADSLLGQGIQPWFSVSYGNRLYSPQAPSWPAVGWAPILTPEAKAAWQRYTRTLVERFRDRVKHWEIWNEANASGFWAPHKPSPEAYVELVKITSAEIRRAAPNAAIIGGAFTGMPMPFLEACLKLGMDDCVDVVSFHPYGVMPEVRGKNLSYEAAFDAWKQLIAQHNPRIKHWQGECGLPSQGGKGAGTLMNFAWNETHQAKWVLRRILMDRVCGLDMTSLFTAVDLDYGMGEVPNKINYKGLIRGTDYTPKPAYFAYQCLCPLFDAQTRFDNAPAQMVDTSLPAEQRDKVYVRRFARHGKAIFAVWFPSQLPEAFEPQTISLRLPLPADATIRQAVLIDPLSQKVLQLDGVATGPESLIVTGLPLADYPLLITDRSTALG